MEDKMDNCREFSVLGHVLIVTLCFPPKKKEKRKKGGKMEDKMF